MQLNLYKVTTKICGLSRQVVFHDRDDKHDFVKTAPEKDPCVISETSSVSLYRFHCTVKPVCNDHLFYKIHYLGLLQWCVLMKTEGTN